MYGMAGHAGYSQEPKADPLPPAPPVVEAPEYYGSVLITMDHIMLQKRGVHKHVFSVESAQETLNSLVSYYGDETLFTSNSTWDLIRQAGMNPQGTIWVYAIPADQAPAHPGHAKSIQETDARIIQVILPYDAFVHLIQSEQIGNGSHLKAVEWVYNTVSSLMQGSKAQRGGLPKLSIFQLEYGAVKE